MSAATPRRAPLEPFLPAVVGIGLAHVLFGMCVWIVYPFLPPRVKPVAPASSWNWYSPADFLIETQPAEAKKELVVEINLPPAPVPDARPVPQMALEPPGNVNTNAAKVADPKPAPPTLVPVRQTDKAVPPPPADTFVNQEKSMTAFAGSSLSPDTASLASQASVSAPPANTPALQVVTPRASPQAGKGRTANKYITLSFIKDSSSAAGAKPTLNLLDIAKLNDNETMLADQMVGSGGLDAVEKALQQALLREWEPPLIDVVPQSQRRATVELVIMRDGTVKNAFLQQPSGSKELDASVRAALGRVTKIAETLPSSFPKERYPVRVNLLIE